MTRSRSTWTRKPATVSIAPTDTACTGPTPKRRKYVIDKAALAADPGIARDAAWIPFWRTTDGQYGMRELHAPTVDMPKKRGIVSDTSRAQSSMVRSALPSSWNTATKSTPVMSA